MNSFLLLKHFHFTLATKERSVDVGLDSAADPSAAYFSWLFIKPYAYMGMMGIRHFMY